MKNIKNNMCELIGNTPILQFSLFSRMHNAKGNILAKLEFFNPGGSAKDRVGKALIEDAEQRGLLKKGSVIIEPTSGNTGIGLSAVALSKGYRVILTMPETMSIERRKLLKAYGAEIVLTDGSLGMNGSIKEANRLAQTIPNSYIPGQFDNHANPQAHYLSTGPEIWDDTDGEIDYFVSAVGTGGTLTGVGEYLKSKNKNIKIIAVEPSSSPVLSGGKAGTHGIQGIGAGFIPPVLNTDIIDEIICVDDEDAYVFARQLAKTEGILVGISSGAAAFAAIKIAQREETRGKNIVVLFPDTGERYLSSGLFN